MLTTVATRYACIEHPRLAPDAWHTFNVNRPIDDGASAAIVCQFSCPARDVCPVTANSPTVWTDTICGPGWYLHDGSFEPYRPDILELHQAAAYIGVAPGSLRYLMRKHDIRPVRLYKTFRYLSLSDVKKLARISGPLCGTAAKLSLHELRGEPPCETCEGIFSTVTK